ncbi:hypothetical protein [Flammeovirga sp. EKP202]|uniref:hypothetical protein n=1 Tax=Flammeovirga sp. EKP202 TaxID=2770592 RepID=UPI00165F6685|nr:hypothetical protein [Flammeovirga sp. EKP202]MBD0404918.1 hypothetical protein [Flammeovirga sp. EKP202]
MKEYIIIIVSISLLFFIVQKGIKAKRKPKSKLSIYDHPSNFKKPPIEMVMKSNFESENDFESIEYNKAQDGK